jgi:hypothetical protein
MPPLPLYSFLRCYYITENKLHRTLTRDRQYNIVSYLRLVPPAHTNNYVSVAKQNVKGEMLKRMFATQTAEVHSLYLCATK